MGEGRRNNGIQSPVSKLVICVLGAGGARRGKLKNTSDLSAHCNTLRTTQSEIMYGIYVLVD